MKVKVRTLGGLGVFVNGAEAEGFATQPLRTALLVYLAVERTATRDQAIALLWPEREAQRARHSLSQFLYELKGDLGNDWIQARGERLRVADRVEADALEFAVAAQEGALDEALSLYRGPFLDGWHLRDSLEFESWVDRQRQRLATLYRETCRELVARSLAHGDRDAALLAARRCAEDDPLDADAQLLLIELLIEEGDLPAALRQYFRYERRLRAEGLTPPVEIAALIEKVKRDMESQADAVASTLLPYPPLRGAAPSVPRLVVLPFEHLGKRDDGYFTDGITEEITNRLVQFPGLAVIARTSANQYRNTPKTVAQIRRELAVDYVLEGTVRWDESAADERVRISPQLIRASDSTHLWAETYEAIPADTFQVQSRVAERVAERVADTLELTLRSPEPARGKRPRPPDPNAHELFVRGKRWWEERVEGALENALECFRKAIELDPTYARAYAGLAETYAMISSFTVTQSMGWLSKAKFAAEKALQLDPSCAESHLAGGMLAYVLDWDMEAAERYLRQAIELEPSNATAHIGLAYTQCTTGRTREAFETMARAVALDPLSVATNFDVAFQAWQGHDRAIAVRHYRLVIQLAPEFDPASYCLGGIYYQEGDLETARGEWSRMSMFGPPWETLVHVLEEPEKAVAILDRIVELAPGTVHWYGVSSLYSLLGATDQAFLVLESHYRNLRGEPSRMVTSGPSLVHLSTDPFFDPLRTDPRYEDLLRRIGLG